MRKGFFFLFLGFLFLGAAIFWGGKLVSAFPQKTSFSALGVVAIPEARVFLNGEEVGRTPFENEKLTPGEYILRLLPETIASFSAWERKIKLNPRLLTYVSYLFGPSEKESAGEILALEKTSGGKGEIVFLSDPDGAAVFLDGQEQGQTPKMLSGFETGEHEVKLSASGYHPRQLKVKTLTGHKLLVSVKLAKIIEEAPSQASESAGLKIKILTTPTGWLRVRKEASVSAREVAKVKPDEEYLLLEEKGEWFKIQYTEGREGWISAEYATKLE